METVKLKMEIMQVAKSFLIFFIAIILANCSKKATNQQKTESSETSISRTRDGSSIIVGQCFDFNSRSSLIPASLNINGVALPTQNGLFQYHLWEGTYTVKVGFIGKEWASKSIKIKKGDSLNIKFFLKDDRSPLYER